MVFKKNVVIAFLFSLCTSIDVFSVMGFRLSLIPLLIYGLIQLIERKTIDNNIHYVFLFFWLVLHRRFIAMHWENH